MRELPSLTNGGITNFCCPLAPRPLSDTPIGLVFTFADHVVLCYWFSIRDVGEPTSRRLFRFTASLLLRCSTRITMAQVIVHLRALTTSPQALLVSVTSTLI